MTINRKEFLRQVGLGAFGALAAPALLARETAIAPPVALPAFDGQKPEDFWRAVQAQYASLDPTLVYFNTGGLGPASTPVLNAFTRVMLERQKESDTGHEQFAPARKVAARFFQAQPEEICLTRNTTEGTSIVASGLRLAAGDEVIIDSHAHPGGSIPWYNQHKIRGVVVKVFEPDPAGPDGNLERIRALITARTKVIQISHVTSPTGIILPAAAIGRLAHEHGAWFHIDGAQSGGMFPFAVRDLGCDSYATSGHKWLGGPHETGIFFIRRERLDDVAPSGIGAYSGSLPHLPGELTYTPSAVRYEYGTRNAASVVALAEALKFQEAIGRERIADRGRTLAAHLRRGLEKIPGVEILTPAEAGLSGSILTFHTPKLSYEKMFGKLWKDYRLRCRPVDEQGLDAVRVSLHVFNFPDECDHLVGAVGEILKKT